VTLHDGFVAAGAPDDTAPVHAVTIGAGAIWGRVYQAVAVAGGRYVQGGGCLTVGVAGFVGGGGFGSLSKQFGTGAANLLEAELVTADGRVRTVNAHRDPELFRALRGGGGGTYGVVTRLTLRTHPLPATIGGVIFSVQAGSDAAWAALVNRILSFYAEALFGPVWGEQIRFSPNRTLSINMLCHGLDDAGARAVWRPFLDWLAARPGDYAMQGEPMILAVPGRRFWDPSFLKSVPGVVLADDRPGAAPSDIFWTGNKGEAGQVIHAYQSAWLPQALLGDERRAALAAALIAGSAAWPMTLHCNKGLAGGSAAALARTAETATNPAVLDAFALLICAADAPPAWPGIPGHEPDLALGRREAAAVRRAMVPIRTLVPDAGAYCSEADYFDQDWQRRYWGSHYPALQAVKRRVDPDNLFGGRNTVTA
jgi:FAD/FMN-containing dehydrogenase